jgi:hypothetical protein
VQSNESLVAEWARANRGYMSSIGKRKLASRLWKKIKRRVKAGTLKLEDYHTVTPPVEEKPSLRSLLKGDS